MKCCNCGREYDPDSIIDCWFVNANGQKSRVQRVGLRSNEQILALCKYCVRAVVFGASAVKNEELKVTKLANEVGIDPAFESSKQKKNNNLMSSANYDYKETKNGRRT